MSNVSGTEQSAAAEGAAAFGSPGGMLKPTPPDSHRAFSLPVSSKAIIPLYNTKDTRKYIEAAVLNQNKVLGGRVLGAAAYMTCDKVVDGFQKVFPNTGRTANYLAESEERFRNAPEAVGAGTRRR